MKGPGAARAALVGAALALLPDTARAEGSTERAKREAALEAEYARLVADGGPYVHLQGGLSVGEGLRFNNPYRLRTLLAESAESVSLIAPYLDLHVSATFGPPDGVQHGARLGLAMAARGVPQQAISLSYLVLVRATEVVMPYARGGISVLTTPDRNVGGELALGAAYFFTGALGVTTELVGDLFYGAGTYEAKYAVYPVLALELGLTADIEVLP